MPFSGILGKAGIAKEVTQGTFVAPTDFCRFIPPFQFSNEIDLLESAGVSGIPDMVTKTAQGQAQLKSGKIKFEVEPEACTGNTLMAAFGTDTVTEVASFVVTTGVNDTIDWGASFTAAVAAGTYPAGLTHATAGSLCAAIYTAMHGQDSTVSEVSFSRTTLEFTIAFASGTPSIKWNSGANTAKSIGPLIGFPKSADSTGSNSYTGDAVKAAFSHAFSRIASSTLPSYSWWQDNLVAHPTFAGCMLNKLEFDIKAKEYVIADADWMGLAYADGSTEAATYSALDPFTFAQVVVTVANAQVNDYEEIKLSIENNTEIVPIINNSHYSTKIYSKGWKVTLSATVTFENTTEYTKFINGTTTSFVIAMTSGAFINGTVPYSLTFSLNNVQYKSAPLPIAKDLLKISFTADAKSSAPGTSDTLTATLVNSRSTAY
jgi:hypothetical protein